jgi:hypothetical protein
VDAGELSAQTMKRREPYRTEGEPARIGPGHQEREMWRVVLEESCDDARRGPEAARVEAWKWFRSDSEAVTSFRWVCAVLDLDSSAVLATLAGTVHGTGKRRSVL